MALAHTWAVYKKEVVCVRCRLHASQVYAWAARTMEVCRAACPEGTKAILHFRGDNLTQCSCLSDE